MTPQTMQTLIVVLLVVLAAAYLGRRAWRAMRPKTGPGCASDCGCDTGESRGGMEV